MKSHTIPLSVVIPCALFGCTSASTSDMPQVAIEPPAQWLTGGRAGEPIIEWWKSFGDPDLDKLVATSLSSNLDLAALTHRLAQAEASARIAGADLLPQVNLSGNATRQRQIFVGLPIPGSPNPLSWTTNSFGVSLDVSWEVDLWGRLRAQKSAAERSFRAARADYEGAALSLIGQTCKSWFALAAAKAQLDVSEATVANQTSTASMVEQRYRRGLRDSLDDKLAKSVLSGAQGEREARREIYEAAKRQIELLLGRYPSAQQQPGSLPREVPPEPPTGVPAEILDRRPDLRAARLRIEAARFRTDQAEASLYPQISLIASAGTLSDQVGDLLDGDFGVWTILGNIVQPIFSGGRLRANVDLRASQQREAIIEFANLVLLAFADVESALSRERHLRAQLDAERRSLADLEDARRLAEERYQTGAIDILTLLQSERSAFQARRRVIDVELLVINARIDLHLALGGGFRLPDEN